MTPVMTQVTRLQRLLTRTQQARTRYLTLVARVDRERQRLLTYEARDISTAGVGTNSASACTPSTSATRRASS